MGSGGDLHPTYEKFCESATLIDFWKRGDGTRYVIEAVEGTERVEEIGGAGGTRGSGERSGANLEVRGGQRSNRSAPNAPQISRLLQRPSQFADVDGYSNGRGHTKPGGHSFCD